MNKTISNIFYNGLYQLLVIAIPIVTVPYVARVLGAKMLGINSYVASIGIFLGIVITMGMLQLGSRIVAQSDRKVVMDNFSRLWIIQFSSGIIITILYVVAAILFLPYKFYCLLETPILIGYILDVSWFFTGIGEVKKVVLRNTLVQISSLLFIFMFVKSPSDLWLYVLLNSSRIIFANGVFWITLVRKWGLTLHTLIRNMSFVYLKESLLLVTPQIAVQLYTSFDSTLVGMIAGPLQLSYYDQSQKTARIVVAVATSVSTVLMPKMAQFVRQNNEELLNKVFKISLDYTLMLCLYFTLLLMANAKEFVPWFFGNQFNPMINNMYFVSLIVIFISYGGVLANQYTLAKGLYTQYAIPYYFGAAFSIVLNIILVSMFKADGGTATIVITEFLVCIVRIMLVHKHLSYSFLFSGQIKMVIVFLGSLLLAMKIPIFFEIHFFNLVVTSLIISIIYFCGLIIMRTRFLSDLLKIKENKGRIIR